MLIQCIRKPRIMGIVASCLLVTTSLALAELTVVFDNGQARPLSDFIGPLDSGKPDTDLPYPEKMQLGAADVASLLPIRSPGLTPGNITPREHSVPFAHSFFLIGSDAISKRWLEQHREALKRTGAAGMLVDASSIEDLQAIANLADGLPITPASGSDIAKALGIRHYPVGISAGRIWQ